MPKPKPELDETEAPEVAGMNEAAEGFSPVLNVLRGDLRDAMLGQLRGATDFTKLDERRQRDIAAAIDYAASEFTAKAVRAIASNGQQQVAAKLEQITVKDGFKIVCTGIFTHDNLAILGDAAGKQVLITIADPGVADGQRSEAKVDKDQPDLLPTEAGGNEDLADAGDAVAAQRQADAEEFDKEEEPADA